MSLSGFILLMILGFIVLVTMFIGLVAIISEEKKSGIKSFVAKFLYVIWLVYMLISITFIWKYGLELVQKTLK